MDGTAQGDVHYFSGAPNVSWADFVRAIFDVTVTDITTGNYRTLATRPANSQLDCSSLKITFGIDRLY